MDSPHLEDALYRACVEADLTQVQLLVEQGVDVNKIIGPSSQLDYSINLAAKSGSVSIARCLLENGATVNAGALRTAAFNGDLTMLNLLLGPIKAHLATSGMSRRWRADLTSILVAATKRGQSETAEALKVFRARVDDFDKAIDAGLLAACAAGDMQSVNYFVGMGAANNVDALFTAAEYNHYEPLKFFLEAYSFEIDELAGPLISAAASGHMPSVILLIEYGAHDEGAALAKAAKFCHADIILHLLDKFKYKSTVLSVALSAAARTGDTDIMNVLIQNGARGPEALHASVKGSHLDATELLIESISLSQSDLSEALEKAMFIWLLPPSASRRNDLSRSSSVSSKDNADTRLSSLDPQLQKSRETKRARIVEVLVDKGARLSDMYYCRLLEMMILTNNPFGQGLLERRHHFTLLEILPDDYLVSLAIYHQQSLMVPLLLNLPLQSVASAEQQAEVSSMEPIAPTIDARTRAFYNPIPSPLILAVQAQNEEWCKILLDRKETDINEWCFYRPNSRPLSYYGLDKKTQTPKDEQYEQLCRAFGKEPICACALSMAVRSTDTVIIHMLIRHGADPWINRQETSILQIATEQDCLKDLVHFLEEPTLQYDIDRREWCGKRSMLHWAAAHGKGDLIDLLCRKGATMDLVDGLHKTPLHVAVSTGNLDTVKALLWAGARTSLRDVDDYLCADELAAKLAQQAFWSDPLRAVRFEISKFLDNWVKNDMDHLDAANIRNEAQVMEQRTAAGAVSRSLQVEDDEFVDHFSDDDSMHWSDDE